MPYKFNCRVCNNYIYVNRVADINTNYNCDNCDAHNWIDSSHEGLEVIDIETFQTKGMKGIGCPNCNIPQTINAIFCKDCGTEISPKELVTIAYCEKCESEYDESNQFCENDGNKLVLKEKEIDSNTNDHDSTSQNANIEDNNTTELSGIGGWLLIPAIGLILAPIKSVAFFYLGINMVQNFSPELLDDSRFWLIGLIDIVAIVAGIIIAVLFFKKLIFAKKAIIGLMAALFIATSFQALLNLSIFGEGDFEFFKPVLHTFVFGSIWIPYFLKSKRVENTFVN